MNCVHFRPHRSRPPGRWLAVTDSFTEWQADMDEVEIEPSERAARLSAAVIGYRRQTEWIHGLMGEPDLRGSSAPAQDRLASTDGWEFDP